MKTLHIICGLLIMFWITSCKSMQRSTNTSISTSNINIKKRNVNIEAPPSNKELAYYSAKSSIETASWLQLKYAIILDVFVESLTNINLLKDIDNWWGTRYCLGGITESCIDCSGFTQVVMKDVYGITLPRTAQEQYNISNKVEKNELGEGDLVFFQTSGKGITHVGIYLTNNKFAHASVSNGVMISDLNDYYWKPRFKGGGRVFNRNEAAALH